MKKQNDNLNQAIDALRHMSIPQGLSDELVRQTLNQIEQTQTTLPRAEKRSFFMKNTFKFATAAMVILGVSLLFLLYSGPTSVAWAQVSDKVNSSGNFIYQSREIMTVIGKNYSESNATTVYTSIEYGIRIDDENSGNKTITSFAEKTITVLMPSIKKFIIDPLSDDVITGMKEKTPKTLVKNYIAAKRKSLGRKAINGIEAEGIEVNDIGLVKSNMPIKSYIGHLWIDIQTELPVLLEAEWIYSQGENDIKAKATFDNFQWNVNLSPDVFKPNITDDYTKL